MTLKLIELVGTDVKTPVQPVLLADADGAGAQGLCRRKPFRGASPRRTLIAPHKIGEGAGAARRRKLRSPIPGRSPNYLEDRYPDRPSLFGGPGGRAIGRMINWWGDIAVVGGMFPLIVARYPGPPEAGRCRLFPQKPRSALRQAAGRSRRPAATRPSRVFARALDPMRLTLKTQAFLGGDGAELCRLHRVRPVPVGARGQSVQACSPTEDPVSAWREKLLDAFDGMARKSPGYPV